MIFLCSLYPLSLNGHSEYLLFVMEQFPGWITGLKPQLSLNSHNISPRPLRFPVINCFGIKNFAICATRLTDVSVSPFQWVLSDICCRGCPQFTKERVNPSRAIFFIRNTNMYSQFLSFFHMSEHRLLKFFPMLDKTLPIIHRQYHGCWCPDDAGSQGISNNDTDLVKPE